MIPNTKFNFEECETGTTSNLVKITFVQKIDGVKTRMDLRDALIEIKFFAPGCSGSTPSLTLSNAEGGIIEMVDAEQGETQVNPFIVTLAPHTYSYKCFVTYSPTERFPYAAGKWPITPIK